MPQAGMRGILGMREIGMTRDFRDYREGVACCAQG